MHQEPPPDYSGGNASGHNLAELYYAQGRYGEAEPLYRRALAIREQALGPVHPNTATVRASYASLLEAMKR